MTPKEVAAQIEEKAARAAEVLAEQRAAFELERRAEVALLEKVVALAKPALPALATKHGPWNLVGPLASDLYLCVRSGSEAGFCRFANGIHNGMLSFEEVVEYEDPEIVIATLAMLLDKQIQGRKGSTESAQRNAIRLRALATLLED